MADEIPFYSDIDIKQNEIKGMVPEQLSSFPAGARLGRVIDHTGLGALYRCIDATGDTTDASKWSTISASGIMFNFGRKGKRLKSQWLRLNGGDIISSITGHRLWFNGTVKIISCQTGATCNAKFHIRKHGGGIYYDVDFLYLNGAAGGDKSLSENLISSDVLGCYMEVISGTVENPSVNIQIVPR